MKWRLWTDCIELTIVKHCLFAGLWRFSIGECRVTECQPYNTLSLPVLGWGTDHRTVHILHCCQVSIRHRPYWVRFTFFCSLPSNKKLVFLISDCLFLEKPANTGISFCRKELCFLDSIGPASDTDVAGWCWIANLPIILSYCDSLNDNSSHQYSNFYVWANLQWLLCTCVVRTLIGWISYLYIVYWHYIY